MSKALLTIISLTVSGSVLAVLLFCLKPLLRHRVSKAFQYYIWLAVLLRLALPVSLPGDLMNGLFVKVTKEIPSMPVSTWIGGRDYFAVGEQSQGMPGKIASSDPTVGGPNMQDLTPQLNDPSGGNPEEVAVAPDVFTESWTLAMRRWLSDNLTGIWITGAIAHFGWFAFAYLRFTSSLRKTFSEPDSHDMALFESLRDGDRVTLVCSKYINTPMLLGLRAPRIVIPQQSFVESGLKQELQHILLHELTHYRRRDLIYKWFAVAVTSLHWFNPLMFLVRRELNHACELSCDEAVVSNWDRAARIEYGETLLALATDTRVPTGIVTTTMCEEKRSLTERLVGIIQCGTRTKTMVAFSALLCVLIAGCGAAFGVLDPDKLKPQEPAPLAEDWFVGDWAGLWQLGSESEPGNSADFGAMLLNAGDLNVCLLRILKTETGYRATLGYTEWELTAHDDTGFSMTCVAVGERTDRRPESILSRFRPDFEVGDTARFTYEARVESTVPSCRVPEERILRGTTKRGVEGVPDMDFLLAYLPTGSERNEEDGIYPYWYGGYEDMSGDFKGMFLLGNSSIGRRFFGAVLADTAGGEWVFTYEDGIYYGMAFGSRDVPSSDLLQMMPVEDVPDAWWPRFSRYDATNPGYTWPDVTSQHIAYFRDIYIPALQNEVKALQSERQQDTRVQRGILVRQGLLHYASLVVGGTLSEKLVRCVPDMLTLDPSYLPEIGLARIKPGDTLGDARRIHSLRPIAEEEAQALGFIHVVERPGVTYYTDGKGLVLDVLDDGYIGFVSVYKAGYETPDSYQVGDTRELPTRVLHGKDGLVAYGESRIMLNIVRDRVWSETQLDIDGDGELERLTLSGRTYMGYLESGTRLGNYEEGTVDPEDYATTRATLRVYKDETLVDETQLPLYLYYLAPHFSGKMQEDVTGKVWIACETGGTGDKIPVYVITHEEGGWRTEYLGMFSARE